MNIINRLTINVVMKMSNTVAWKLGCDNSYTYDENWIISLMGTYSCILTTTLHFWPVPNHTYLQISIIFTEMDHVILSETGIIEHWLFTFHSKRIKQDCHVQIKILKVTHNFPNVMLISKTITTSLQFLIIWNVILFDSTRVMIINVQRWKLRILDKMEIH